MPRIKKPRLKRRADGRYRCKWRGVQFYSTVSADDAYAKRDAYIMRAAAGLSQSVTVAGYALPWLQRTFPDVAPSTYAGLAVHVQHLVDRIGNKRVSDVVPSDIKGVYSTEYANRSNSYLKAARQLYCQLFDAAAADGVCRSNPARDRTAKPHKGAAPRTRPITEQERRWILTLCTDHRCHAAVMAMLYAGLRPPEAKALDIDRDVDFAARVITLREFAHNDPQNSQKYAFSGVGKTEAAARRIPLFPPLESALNGKHGRLITSAHGEPVTPTTWRVVWRSYKTSMETAINGMPRRWYGRTKEHKARLASGLPLPEWRRFDIVPYDLRHSFCVMLRDAGVEMNTARRWMGHADANMILRVYDSVSRDRSEAEREKVETALFGVRVGVQSETAARAMREK